jgi:hypothetical protein
MSKLSSKDFVYVYLPGEAQTYQCGRYTIRAQRIAYRHFYSALFGTLPLGGSETFLGAVEICARHQLITQ